MEICAETKYITGVVFPGYIGQPFKVTPDLSDLKQWKT